MEKLKNELFVKIKSRIRYRNFFTEKNIKKKLIWIKIKIILNIKVKS